MGGGGERERERENESAHKNPCPPPTEINHKPWRHQSFLWECPLGKQLSHEVPEKTPGGLPRMSNLHGDSQANQISGIPNEVKTAKVVLWAPHTDPLAPPTPNQNPNQVSSLKTIKRLHAVRVLRDW